MTPESYRRSKDWTLEELGQRLDLSKGRMSVLERTVGEWPLETALRMHKLSDGLVPARDLVPEDKRELLDQLIAGGAQDPTQAAS